MASTYEYITVTILENKSSIDYSVVDAKYTDTIIEKQITTAEQWINTQLPGTTPTATDGVIGATVIMAERFMNNLMVRDGYGEPETKAMEKINDDLVRDFLKEDKYDPVSSIPMQGVNRY